MKTILSELLKDFFTAIKSVSNKKIYYNTSVQAQNIANCTPCEKDLLWGNYTRTKSLRIGVIVSVYLKLFADVINSLPSTWDVQIEGEYFPLNKGERETTLTNSIPSIMKETKIPLIKIGTDAYLEQSYQDSDNSVACQRAMKEAMVSSIYSENLKNTRFLALSILGVAFSFTEFIIKKVMKK